MSTQRQLRITYDSKDAQEALKKHIPSMEDGLIINTCHGDISLHDEDARAVMNLVKTLAEKRASQKKEPLAAQEDRRGG